MSRFLILIFLLLLSVFSNAQDIQRCAAVERLQHKFNADKNLRQRFEERRSAFNTTIASGYFKHRENAARIEGEIYHIPVVVHIVLADPSSVSDEAVLSQLDALNKAFSAAAPDTAGIPDYFKAIAGKSVIQFCLAQQTPEGLPTTGIHRVIAGRTGFSANNEGVKHRSLGGADSWNTSKYMNIWITELSGGILGYSSFPDDGSPDEQGVVIDYRTLPGGAYKRYNNGKTLVHESGHFFNLYHIWGDDNGSCSGTDYVDDTPPQANSTTTCATGKKFDQCTPSGDGIMYQNYMDYTEDECLIIFTAGQILRMEAAATTYFSSLLSSEVCRQVNLPKTDLKVVSIENPGQRICAPGFNGLVTIQNMGVDTIRSAIVSLILSNGDSVSVSWKGALAYKAAAIVELPLLSVPEGKWTISCMASRPNNSNDENPANDAVSAPLQYYSALNALSDGFEGNDFPAPGWDISGATADAGWIRAAGIAAGGSASAAFENNASAPASALLRLREINLREIDSAWLSFAFTGIADTLEILVSLDCGETYTSVYNSIGQTQTIQKASEGAFGWIRDSVNISNYINKGNVLFAFRRHLSGVSTAYLDDINIRKVIVNPNLKSAGFMVTPNPVSSTLMVQFYPEPTALKRIVIYSMSGQVVREMAISRQSSFYLVDVSALRAGVYVIAAVFNDSRQQKKFVRR